MDCVYLPRKYNFSKSQDYNDPIFIYIDKILEEYKKLKKDLIEKTYKIDSLTKNNFDLKQIINKLKSNLSTSSTKRRKTNSLEAQANDDNDGKLFVRAEDNPSVYDTLNTALSTDLMNESDLLVASAQLETNVHKTPEKQISCISKILSPITNTKTQNTNESKIGNKMQLPKRKIKSKFTNDADENRIPKNIGWNSSSSKKPLVQKKSSTWGMSFIQPNRIKSPVRLDTSGDVIACSQDVEIPSKKEKKISKSSKLKQSKLEFDTKNISAINDNETFCDEVINDSPTCTSSILRKLTRKSDDSLFIFPMKKTLPSQSLTTTNVPIIKNEMQSKIKSEVEVVSKDQKNKFFENLLTEDSICFTGINDNNISMSKTKKMADSDVLPINKPTLQSIPAEDKKIFFNHMLTEDSITFTEINNNPDDISREKLLDNDSSIFILPSQTDDVVIIEASSTVNYNLSSMDLLAEMMKNDSETQPLLKKLEDKQIKNIQSSFENSTTTNIAATKVTKDTIKTKVKTIVETDLQNVGQLSEIFNDENDFTFQPKILSTNQSDIKGYHHDCDDCRDFKKYLISQNIPTDEIERRLRTCKRQMKLHLTPDGFWDPCFREFSPNDPRNEVLIDYRFVDKKK